MPTFSGHESFPVRHAWFAKGVQACATNPSIFKDDDAMMILGVGKNMVRSIRYWCICANLLHEDNSRSQSMPQGLYVSDIAKKIFLGRKAWDPYMEDVGTLWLLHWHIGTNLDKATTFFYAFNVYSASEFTKEILLDHVREYARSRNNKGMSDSTLKTDIDVFIRSYCRRKDSKGIYEDAFECPFLELNLVRPLAQPGMFAFNRGAHDALPDSVFAYSVLSYAALNSGRKSYSFDELCYAPGSPGRVFKLDEQSLYHRLERLEKITKGALVFAESAGLRQLYMRTTMSPIDVMEGYYAE